MSKPFRLETLLAIHCAVLVGCAGATGTNETRTSGNNVLPPRAQKLHEGMERLNTLALIAIGSSEKEVARAIERSFSPVTTNNYLGKYPFNEMIPNTNKDCTAEWTSRVTDTQGAVEIVFGIFSNSSKTNLVDALSYRNGHIEPLVNGAYNKKLYSLKKGDSIQQVYTDLGKRECEYYLNEDGKWCVRFLYFAFGGRVVVVEADAAEGRILCAEDATR